MTADLGLVEWFRPGEFERVEEAIAHLRRLDVGRLRTGVSWADWASPDGESWYQWLLPRLHRELELLPCLSYTPPSLGVEPRASAPPRDLDAFAGFVGAVLERCGHCVEWLELWNEPNNLSDWDWRLDPGWTQFAAMLHQAIRVTRAAGKRVVLGGMCPIDPSWLDRMQDLGILAAVDAIGVHGFPGTWDFDWTDWASSLARVRAALERHGRMLPLWITETAYSTWRHDERGQIDALLRAVEAPADRVYWSALQDLDPAVSHRDGFHMDERHYHLGLVRADGTPKLVYRLWVSGGLEALRAAAPWLATGRRRRKRPVTLLTGGAGFIGANLAERLLDGGEQVMIYDNLSRPGVEQNLHSLSARYPSLEVQVADVRDKYKVAQAVRGAHHVFHLAAQVAVTTSLVQPSTDFEVNATGTLNVLEAARARPTPPSVLFTSTNKVYGPLADVPLTTNGTRYEPSDAGLRTQGLDEGRPLEFLSPYGCSKGTADQYVLEYARSYRVPAVVFRMSCIYGPYQCGTEDQGWVAHFLAHALARRPLVIYGDGRQVRDLLYAQDLVAALLMAQQHIIRLSGRAFNLGGGPSNSASLLELLRVLEPLVGHPISVSFQDWRPGDQRYYVSDTRRFANATGWRPATAVADGLAQLAAWLVINSRVPAARAIAS